MRDVLSNVLAADEPELGVDRILAAAFFRKRPLQAGTTAHVVALMDRKPIRERCEVPSFLQGGQRR